MTRGRKPKHQQEQRCPDETHSEECLCDVVVNETTRIADIDFANDSWFAKEIIAHLGLSSPWDDEKMLRFLSAQALFYEEVMIGLRMARIDDAERERRHSERKTLLTPEQMREVQEMFITGATSVSVRIHLKSKYGIDMTPSYASHLRRRTIEMVEGKKQ
jgi:hypothetical protein